MGTDDAHMRTAGRRTAKVLWLTTPLACVAVVGALLQWAFSPDLLVRRAAVAVCVAVVLVCVAAFVFARGRAGHVSVAQAYEAVRPARPLSVSGLPASIPSGRSVRIRGLAGALGFLAALIGMWGLVGGDDSHAEQADAIRRAGAQVVQAPVTQVGAGERDASAQPVVTVLLKEEGGHENITASLAACSHDEAHPGGTLEVMYAPGDARLGAVHGDAAELDRLMEGRAMTPALTWGLGIAWLVAAGFAVGGTVWNGRFRTVTDLRRGTRGVRGVCAGAAPWDPDGSARPGRRSEALLLETEDGEPLRFGVERQASAIAEVADSEPVWVCWEAPGESGHGPGAGPEDDRFPAVVIADSGWALHGEVRAPDAGRLEPYAVVPGRDDIPVDAGRTMQLWSPATSWPMILRGSSMLCVVLALACAAVLVTDLGVRWRWGLGVIGTTALLAAFATYAGPAAKKVPDTLNRRRPSSVSRVSV